MIRGAILLAIATIVGYLYAQYQVSSGILSRFEKNSMLTMHSIKGFVNVYIVKDPVSKQNILIDAGNSGDEELIANYLKEHQIEKLDAVHLTHGHGDHAGTVSNITQRFPDISVGCHKEEHSFLKSGQLFTPKPTIRLIKWLMPYILKYNIVKPPKAFDCGIIYSNASETHHGIKLYHTPGHSNGSVSFELPNGECIIGDLMGGGFLFANSPSWPLFYQDYEQIRQSVQFLLKETNCQVFYVGHGKPFDRPSLLQWLEENPTNPADL